MEFPESGNGDPAAAIGCWDAALAYAGNGAPDRAGGSALVGAGPNPVTGLRGSAARTRRAGGEEKKGELIAATFSLAYFRESSITRRQCELAILWL
jgi:hypothetical protein